ncbi:unnamed protein product [Auanema sp. JU1783]|nr:unnamed protein product [Auanema sp. JU1783]
MSTEESSIFQKICCCYNRGTKEPPVELIRTQSIAGPTTQIAKETVDGFEEVNLEQRASLEAANETAVVANKPIEDDFVLNDIMMDEICGDTIKEERAEPIVEDEVSIHTNVIEEVDEKDLVMIKQQSLKSEWNETPQLSEDLTDQENMTDRSNEEKVSINQVIKEGYESPGRPDQNVSSSSSTNGEISVEKEISFVDSDANVEAHNEPKSSENKISHIGGEQLNLKESLMDDDSEVEGIVESVRSHSAADIAALLSARKDDDDGDDSDDDEILIEEVPDKITPSLVVPKSVMYAELSDDDEEEISHPEILRPPSRSKHHTFHQKPVTEENNLEDDVSESEGEVVEDVPIPSPRRHVTSRAEDSKMSDTDSDDENEDGTVEEDKEMTVPIRLSEISPGHEKENEGVTRLSVKSDGKATITNGSVRLALDIRDVTDDEFSEQLI